MRLPLFGFSWEISAKSAFVSQSWHEILLPGASGKIPAGGTSAPGSCLG
jgi:hypothetical protein